MTVTALVGMCVRYRPAPRKLYPFPEERHADSNDEKPGDCPKPGEERLRENIFGGKECDEAHDENTDRMCGRHGEPKKSGVLRRASRANKICAHDSLAVTGSQCMSGA